MHQRLPPRTCSQANDSSVCPSETLLLHFEAHPVPKTVLYFSTQLLLLFFTSFSLQNTAPGLGLLEMKKTSFLFPYIQLCFCNRTKGSTALQYTAQLSTSALQYWPCSRKICECLLMLLTSEARLLRRLHLFKRPWQILGSNINPLPRAQSPVIKSEFSRWFCSVWVCMRTGHEHDSSNFLLKTHISTHLFFVMTTCIALVWCTMTKQPAN